MIESMEKRTARVSEAQWSRLLEFLELHPNLARTRGYNNTSRGRAESTRLWQELADQLNAEGSGTTKTPKEWSIYVSNYKSKLKKTVADINADATSTGGGPPQGSALSDVDNRFLALMGPGFGQTAPQVTVKPFPNEDLQQSSPSILSPTPEIHEVAADARYRVIEVEHVNRATDDELIVEVPASLPLATATPTAAGAEAPTLPRRTRQSRYRSRPLAPLDEARRILSQVEMQRAEADAESARALHLVGQNLGLIGQNLGRIADVVEKWSSYFETSLK